MKPASGGTPGGAPPGKADLPPSSRAAQRADGSRATRVAHYRPRELTLRDGRRVMLRGIVEADAAEIVQAFERLSADSRYMRFMQHKRQIDPDELHRGVRPVPGREFAFVATVPADDGIDIVGATRYVPSQTAVTCEFAITVADGWRQTGLSDQLLASLIRRARRDGYRVIEGLVLATNSPMLTLARRLGFTLTPQDGELTVVRVWRDLQRPPRRYRPVSARRTAP
jgi:RimJ/RimL family protein N-acetyltransferase